MLIIFFQYSFVKILNLLLHLTFRENDLNNLDTTQDKYMYAST